MNKYYGSFVFKIVIAIFAFHVIGDDEMSPFSWIENNNISALKTFISGNGNINLRDDILGATLLHAACRQGSLDIVKLLVSGGADINAPDRDGATPLISTRNTEVISSLLSLGAKVDTKDNEGWTAIMYAIRDNRNDIVDILLKAGAKKPTDRDYWFIKAIEDGDIQKVKEYIKNGVNVDQEDFYAGTPLNIAIKRGNKDIIDILINNGADVNKAGDNDEPPLIRAILVNSNIDIINMLLQGAKVNLECYLENDLDSGETPLQHALFKKRYDIVELLIKRGADVKTKTGRGGVLFYVLDNDKMFNFLIDKGADIRAKRGMGSLLHFATSPSIVKKIIELAPDLLNCENHIGLTPLDFAEKYGWKDKAELLRKYGAMTRKEIKEKRCHDGEVIEEE